MEKPDRVSEETYIAFKKAMRNVVGNTFQPSRNYLKREIQNPTYHVGCFTCNAKQTTLYKIDGELFCNKHKGTR